ncbi:hypothetical protein [Enterococcus avium]|uniref:hypothetical protein n=1 Tax=Enterococcus avium TaxID=33945 RepID=UPI003D6A7C03
MANLLFFCLIGDYPFSWPPQALYGLVTLGTDFAYYLLVRALVRANGKESKIGQLFKHYPKSYLSIGLAIVALILGKLIAPIAVLVVNVLILLMWFIPEKSIEKIL